MKKLERKLNRLPDYNYSQNGWYFVTVCTKNKVVYLGDIKNKQMILNKYGKIVEKYWLQIPNYYEDVKLDLWVVMPNHIHGIIVVENDMLRTEQCSVLTEKRYGLLSKIIKSFKEACVKDIHKQFNNFEFAWQRSFYDHVIRDERSLDQIREYVQNNPLKWDLDENNPEN